jgi:hypothetical protein
MAKNELAKAKTMRNRDCANQAARQATHIPKVEALIPRVEMPHLRVTKIAEVHPTQAVTVTQHKDRHAIMSATTPPVHQQIAQAPTSKFKSLSCMSLSNYISQDEDNYQAPMRQTTRSAAKSIMQEAMLSCVDIYKPNYIVFADLGIVNYTKAPKLTRTAYTVVPKQVSQCKLPMKWLCKMANSVIGVNGELLDYHHLITNQTTRATWQHSYGNKIERLAQGMPGCNTGNNTIAFIKTNQVPQSRVKDITYGLITCLIRPEKLEEPNQIRLVVGGDRVHYLSNARTPTADLLTVKLLINSTTISTPNAKYMTMDIKDFYLNTPPMARYKYMQLQIADMPDDVIKHYNLTDLATLDGYVYCKIKKGMYGLPQAGIISQQLLEKQLQQHGYHQHKTTPGL